MSAAPAPSPLTPLAVLQSLVGTVEAPGAADNPVILAWAAEIGRAWPEMAAYCAGYTHDSIAWCGLTQALALTRCGIRPPFVAGDDLKCFLWALAWADWGTAVPLGGELPGDVPVYDFGGGDHHVTMLLRRDGANYICIGGNQSDQLKQSTYAVSSCIALRRPPPATLVVQPVQPAPVAPVSPAGAAFAASGKGSWYSQFAGQYQWVDTGDQPNSNALGVPDAAQGISFYNSATLGQWFEVRAPNGVVSTEQQTDIGPAPHTGRTIDISAAAAERFGYTPRNFPTDQVFAWRAVAAPAAVAGLPPQQQATAYLTLRKAPTMDATTTTQPQPQTLPATLPAPPFNLDLGSIEAAMRDPQKMAALADQLDRAQAFIAMLRGLAPKPATPAQPAANAPAVPAVLVSPPTAPASLLVGVLGLLGTVVANALGYVGSPAGVNATAAGQIIPSLFGSLAALGAAGGPKLILQSLLQGFIALPK